MLALVTGANGFVGSHLVDRLLAEGHRVRALVRSTSDLRYLPVDRIELHTGELSRGEIPDGALDGIQLLFHTAAVLKAPGWEAFRRINVDAAVQLHSRLAARGAPGARFVFISSQAAAGPSGEGETLRESDEPHPQTLYGRSKLEAERALQGALGPGLTIIRPPAVYGPRDAATLPIFRLAAAGWAFCMGSPERRISMVHVEDLCRGIVQAAIHPRGTGTFFLTDGHPHPWREIATALAHAAGRRVRIVTLPDATIHLAGMMNEWAHRAVGRTAMFNREKARDFTARGWACSSAAAEAAFGFRPGIELVDGMKETMDWYRREGWL